MQFYKCASQHNNIMCKFVVTYCLSLFGACIKSHAKFFEETWGN